MKAVKRKTSKSNIINKTGETVLSLCGRQCECGAQVDNGDTKCWSCQKELMPIVEPTREDIDSVSFTESFSQMKQDPRGDPAGKRRHIGILGFTNSGKTVHLASLFYATTENLLLRNWAADWDALDDGATGEYLRNYVNKMLGRSRGWVNYEDPICDAVGRQLPDGTTKNKMLSFQLHRRVGLTWHSLDVQTMDVSGELLNPENRGEDRWLDILQHCRQCDALLFFTNRLLINAGHSGASEFVSLVNRMLAEGVHPKAFIIVVTGMDACRTDEEVSAGISDVITRYDAALQGLARRNIRYEVVPSSSLGHHLTTRMSGTDLDAVEHWITTENRRLTEDCRSGRNGHVCLNCQKIRTDPHARWEPWNLEAPWESIFRTLIPWTRRNVIIAQASSCLSSLVAVVRDPICAATLLLSTALGISVEYGLRSTGTNVFDPVAITNHEDEAAVVSGDLEEHTTPEGNSSPNPNDPSPPSSISEKKHQTLLNDALSVDFSWQERIVRLLDATREPVHQNRFASDWQPAAEQVHNAIIEQASKTFWNDRNLLEGLRILNEARRLHAHDGSLHAQWCASANAMAKGFLRSLGQDRIATMTSAQCQGWLKILRDVQFENVLLKIASDCPEFASFHRNLPVIVRNMERALPTLKVRAVVGKFCGNSIGNIKITLIERIPNSYKTRDLATVNARISENPSQVFIEFDCSWTPGAQVRIEVREYDPITNRQLNIEDTAYTDIEPLDGNPHVWVTLSQGYQIVASLKAVGGRR